MIFNSLDFAIFLPIVFTIYWLLNGQKLRIQNLFLLIASYFFYAWWDWRFLFLIFASSFVDFIAGQRIYASDSKKTKKRYLYLSLGVNLGLLGFFKYFNFFIENFVNAFTLLGMPIEISTLNIILPVGISFYTFQTLSYTIDIYKDRMTPTKDPIAFFGYVSFFPQLVAGPIERAQKLLPQFLHRRSFDHDKAVDGMRQMLWGLFKKVVVADNCAPYVQDIFSNVDTFHSPILFVGMFLFMGQLYCDFSGYSDIAIGCARLFGFNLSRNFNYPAFSTSIPDFWQKWHITLTNWFRDYVYLPMISRKRLINIRNTFILFLLIGFWHGAKWTFIAFGAINAVLFLIQADLMRRKRKKTKALRKKGKSLPPSSTSKLIGQLDLYRRILSNYFILICLSVFFRAETIQDAAIYLYRFFNPENWFTLDIIPIRILSVKMVVIIATLFGLVFEWFHQDGEHSLEMNKKIYRYTAVRWMVYTFLLLMIFQYRGVELDFIYFQF